MIAYFRNQFQFLKNKPHFVVAVFSDGLIDDNERILSAIQNIMQIRIKYLLPVIQMGQKNGIFRCDIESDELLQIIMGTFRLQMFKWRMANFSFDIEEQGNKMLHNILKIIK
ncbi:MAG: TetR/AcrR family transcriptional regulator C-terminal domain-containing protein [Flavobacteriia bacterium]